MSAYLTELQSVILNLHGSESSHQKSVPVIELFQGKILWEGIVEIFHLLDHPKAKIVFAWAYLDDNETMQYVTVLSIPPVDTPERAVRALIASRLKATLSATAEQSGSVEKREPFA